MYMNYASSEQFVHVKNINNKNKITLHSMCIELYTESTFLNE